MKKWATSIFGSSSHRTSSHRKPTQTKNAVIIQETTSKWLRSVSLPSRPKTSSTSRTVHSLRTYAVIRNLSLFWSTLKRTHWSNLPPSLTTWTSHQGSCTRDKSMKPSSQTQMNLPLKMRIKLKLFNRNREKTNPPPMSSSLRKRKSSLN